MKSGMTAGMYMGGLASMSNFPPGGVRFPRNAAEMAAALGGTGWQHFLLFQESSGNLTTPDTGLTATATVSAPSTITYRQPGPLATHSTIELGGANPTLARFVFPNAAIEPGSGSFGVMACLYMIDTAATYTFAGIETGADYWRLRTNASGDILFQIFDGALSNTVTLSGIPEVWLPVLATFNATTKKMSVTTSMGTVSNSSVSLGAINSASRGLAVGSTAGPPANWAHFAYTTDITGLETDPEAAVLSYMTYTGLV